MRMPKLIMVLGTCIFVPLAFGAGGLDVEWVAEYCGSKGGEGRPVDFVVDPSGSVYVTGISEREKPEELWLAHGGRYNEFATIKYDCEGKELWTARYSLSSSTADAPFGLALDKTGNLYVAGVSYDLDRQKGSCTLIKYSASGKQLWASGYPHGSVSAVCVDSAGNAYVAGVGTKGRSATYQIIKYAPSGEQVWVRHFKQRFKILPCFRDMKIDGSDNIYLAGGGGIVKCSPDGDALWTTTREAEKIALDDDGCVSCIGRIYPFPGRPYFVTSKYSAAGKQLWTRKFTVSAGKPERLLQVGVDKSGGVYVGGSYKIDDKSLNFVIMKYDADGNPQWERPFAAESPKYRNLLRDILVTNAGDIYVLVQIDEGMRMLGPQAWTLLRYGKSGKLAWQETQRWKYSNSHPEYMRVNNDGFVYLIGRGGRTCEFVTAKFQQPKIKTPGKE